ncbi:MAG: ATP-grasp domain-containing protein [bacterium]|nr:ATP-grasp domain-containing protein [bacterium]MBU1917710.1 ATP-grasp domain-containing protein [bacterium]
MLIAFTHNLQLTDCEEEAEFDKPETINAIVQALNNLGHSVELVEVSGPASRIVSLLESLNPDLVFNTAEGKTGRYREAFYPGLFEQLNLPFTGSDAYVCALTMDKRLTKDVVASAGVPTPRYVYIDALQDWQAPDLTYPVIVKPNYEGSSMGITQDSVAVNPEELYQKTAQLFTRYPSGVLVEEYIDGKDVVVPFIEKASRETSGILPAGEYLFDATVTKDYKYKIYDYALKQYLSHAVSVKVPAQLSPDIHKELVRLSQIVYRKLFIRDLGRIDYRISPDGQIYFIEVNALPSLEPGATIYESAALVGLTTMEAVLGKVIQSSVERYNIQITKRIKKRKRAYKVGLTYNLKRIPTDNNGEQDQDAEYDSIETIDAIAGAIESYGHEVLKLEATSDFPSKIDRLELDFVFNIAEGLQGRNRESQIPAILELFNIPYVGSDPATLSISLDKALAKRMVREAGIATPNFALLRTGKERLPKNLRYPVILKPAFEGSSKGVMPFNVVKDEAILREVTKELISKYQQPVLAEEFLPGREFTIGLLGEIRPKTLPVMEIVFKNTKEEYHVYSYTHKQAFNPSVGYDIPAKIDMALQKNLERVAKNVFTALGCRDVARVDLRLDHQGVINFIECNPLPGLTPDWSDLCLAAKAAGMDYRALIGEIMAPAIKRVKQKEKSTKILKIAS